MGSDFDSAIIHNVLKRGILMGDMDKSLFDLMLRGN